MLGITIRLGAAKDQIIDSKTREVLVDRHQLRNGVRRVQRYKPKTILDNIESAQTHKPIGMEYVHAPDYGMLNAANGMIVDHFRKPKGKRRAG